MISLFSNSLLIRKYSLLVIFNTIQKSNINNHMYYKTVYTVQKSLWKKASVRESNIKVERKVTDERDHSHSGWLTQLPPRLIMSSNPRAFLGSFMPPSPTLSAFQCF